MTVMDAEDDLAAVFDGGYDEQLAVLRVRYPLFAIAHTRAGWSAWPVWLPDAQRIEAADPYDLAAKLDRYLAELG